MFSGDAEEAQVPRIELTLLKPDAPPRTFEFEDEVVTMGRSSDCLIPINDRFLSRRHAELVADGDGWLLRDGGSTNGTFVNGARVAAPVGLHPGDRIRLGSAELIVGGAAGPRQATADAPSITDMGAIPAPDFVLRETDIPRHAERAQVVNRLALELISDRPLVALFEFIIDSVVDVMTPSRAALALLGEGDRIDIAVSRQTDGSAPSELRISRTMLREVIRDRKVVAYTDSGLDQLAGAVSIMAQRIYSALCVPLVSGESVLGVLYLDYRTGHRVITRDDAELAAQIARVAAMKLESTRLREAAVEKEKLEATLRVARAIQMRMLPSITPELKANARVEIAAEMHAATQVGGDFYEFHLAADDRFYFCIGDVSGKGIPAALLMAVTRTLFRSMILAGMQPAAIVSAVNRQLCDELQPEMFVTACCGVLDLRSRAVRWANAGHLPPLVISPDGAVSELRSPPCLVLGYLPDFPFVEEAATLAAGGTLCLYTDGISEAANAADELFSLERLREVLSKHATDTVDDIARSTLAAVELFAGDAPQSDDMTILIIRSPAALSTQPEAADGGAVARPEAAETLMQTRFFRELGALPAIFAMTDEFCARNGVNPGDRHALALVVEELFTNVVKHGSRLRDEIQVTIDRAEGNVVLSVTDFDADEFDVTREAEPRVDAPLEERRPGGLGLHLVRKLVDRIDYDYRDRRSTITIYRKLEGADVRD